MATELVRSSGVCKSTDNQLRIQFGRVEIKTKAKYMTHFGLVCRCNWKLLFQRESPAFCMSLEGPRMGSSPVGICAHQSYYGNLRRGFVLANSYLPTRWNVLALRLLLRIDSFTGPRDVTPTVIQPRLANWNTPRLKKTDRHLYGRKWNAPKEKEWYVCRVECLIFKAISLQANGGIFKHEMVHDDTQMWIDSCCRQEKSGFYMSP
jgi:hypothetical protein